MSSHVSVTAYERILRMREVQHRTGLSRTTIYRRMGAGTFPSNIPLGANSCGWYESEIESWIADPSTWNSG
ncbi:MAG: AlpA family transcriptional regulator [Sphingomonadaceae bacterium]|nr:AlpA family transcriptional regulator [Sphingomonadaceae bacterium]